MHRIFICSILLTAASFNLYAASKGLRFEAIVLPSSIEIPGPSAFANTPILLALKITNTTDKDILVDKFASIIPNLRTVNGDLINTTQGQDGSYQPQGRDFIFLKPNRTIYMLIDCTLCRDSDGKLQFQGETQAGGFWRIERLPLKASKYFLSLVYWSEKRDFPSDIASYFYGKIPWYGKFETKPIAIELEN